MDCSCTVEHYYEESDHDHEILIEKGAFVSSREIHCEECERVIAPGEPHYAMVWIMDPDSKDRCIARVHHCDDCAALIECLFSEGYYWTQVLETLQEAIRSEEIGVSESCLDGLSPRNMGLVCRWVEESWDNYDDDQEAA